jgi:hypothetical protein
VSYCDPVMQRARMDLLLNVLQLTHRMPSNIAMRKIDQLTTCLEK